MSVGRVLFAVIAVMTSFGGFVADWNHTHVYNPRWPPHAKFHNGQTMSCGLLLGFTSLYYLIWPLASERDSLNVVMWLLSLNWIAQLSAALYPGALPTDPEFGDGFPQAYGCAVLFVVLSVGYTLERKRLVKAGLWNRQKLD